MIGNSHEQPCKNQEPCPDHPRTFQFLTEDRLSSIRQLREFVEAQEECPPEFVAVINKEFWELF